ncbi:NAD-dependent epimerase/dehydratase family protein [Teichococcus vastitatis]|uniref:SDR family oxidoreductase n=1 Tax=Teichococcus vastitatis TaxID=2307076 RepID=A0ABS9W4X9_9PROT|nr:SDR family oxidoreductase [Pseudoroseomonas vastitatis]MCI0753669.1 SDR family oxidoreductase [Pseudoroseomonas vastitatis]
MRILITGNMGYVGPVVAAHFRKVFPGATLVGFDRGWFGHCLTTQDQLPETLLDEQRFGDVRDLGVEDLRGFDAVVHLAAISNDPMGQRFEAVTDAINHQASVSVAKAAAEAGVKRFVFASSCSVYGIAGDGNARVESDQLNPLTAYARSKIDTENSLRALDNSGMVISCLRFATACGMSPRLRLDLVLNDFVAGALANKEVSVLSDGTPWRPLIHVRDMARAMEWAITRRPENGGHFLTVNVGSERWNYQVRDLAEAVGRAMPEARVSIATSAPPDKRSYKVDFSLFAKLAPQHQPQETLDGAIAELRDRLTEQGFSDPNYRKSFAIRLVTLEKLISSGAVDGNLEAARELPQIRGEAA